MIRNIHRNKFKIFQQGTRRGKTIFLPPNVHKKGLFRNNPVMNNAIVVLLHKGLAAFFVDWNDIAGDLVVNKQ
jgi:hypothetical protein